MRKWGLHSHVAGLTRSPKLLAEERVEAFMWDYLSRVQRTSLCEPVRYGTIVRGGLEVPKSWSQLPAEYDAVGAMMRELGKQPVFWPTGPAGESDNARKWRLRVNTHNKKAAAKSRHSICTSAWQAGVWPPGSGAARKTCC